MLRGTGRAALARCSRARPPGYAHCCASMLRRSVHFEKRRELPLDPSEPLWRDPSEQIWSSSDLLKRPRLEELVLLVILVVGTMLTIINTELL